MKIAYKPILGGSWLDFKQRKYASTTISVGYRSKLCGFHLIL